MVVSYGMLNRETVQCELSKVLCKIAALGMHAVYLHKWRIYICDPVPTTSPSRVVIDKIDNDNFNNILGSLALGQHYHHRLPKQRC